MQKSACPYPLTSKKDIKKKGGSALEEKDRNDTDGVGMSEKEIEHSIKKGIKTPRIKVLGRLLLATLVIASLISFVTGIITFTEIQREAEAYEEKIEEYEEYKERLEYYLNSPIDRDYIVQIAKEMFNLFLPDEIIFNNDTNK